MLSRVDVMDRMERVAFAIDYHKLMWSASTCGSVHVTHLVTQRELLASVAILRNLLDCTTLDETTHDYAC